MTRQASTKAPRPDFMFLFLMKEETGLFIIELKLVEFILPKNTMPSILPTYSLIVRIISIISTTLPRAPICIGPSLFMFIRRVSFPSVSF